MVSGIFLKIMQEERGSEWGGTQVEWELKMLKLGDENVGFSILIRLLSCCNFSMVKELKNAEIKKLKEGPLQVFLGDTIGNVSHSQVQREQ